MSARDRYVSASMLLYMRQFDELAELEERIQREPGALGLRPAQLADLSYVLAEAEAGAVELIGRVLREAPSSEMSKHFSWKAPTAWKSNARRFCSGRVRLAHRSRGRRVTRCVWEVSLEEDALELWVWFVPKYYSAATAKFTEAIARRARLTKALTQQRTGCYLALRVPLHEGMPFDEVVSAVRRLLDRIVVSQRSKILSARL